MRRRIALFAAPLAALSLIAAGCGGGGDNTSTSGGNGTTGGTDTTSSGGGDAATVLSGIKAPDNTKPAKMALKLSVDLKGNITNQQVASILDGGPITVSLEGPVDPGKKSGDLSFDLKAGKIALNGGVRMIDGSKGFVQLNDKWYELPADSLKTSSDATDANKVMEAIGDPAKLLKDPEYKGEEDIDGIKTEHVSGEVDNAGLVEAIGNVAKSQGETVDQKQADEATQKLGEYLKDAKVDLWVGKDDKQIHKIQLVGDVVLPADAKQQAGGLDGAGFDLTVQSTPTDSPSVETPSGALPSSQLQTDLGTILLQSLGGSSGSSTGP